MRSVDAIMKSFRQEGFRITPQRRVIFEQLAEGDGHPTADQVYQDVQAVMPEVSRTTVYNTLHELVALGELTEVGCPTESGTRYDTNDSHHHHLFCVQCQSIIDIEQDFECVELVAEQTEGYRILHHQITFYGICPTCQDGRIG
jgi:Fe2+ or Zn2+ uptake regulation protein